MFNRAKTDSVLLSSLSTYAQDNPEKFNGFREEMRKPDNAKLYSRIFNGFSHAGNSKNSIPCFLISKENFSELGKAYAQILLNISLREIEQVEDNDAKQEEISTGNALIFNIKNPDIHNNIMIWLASIIDLGIQELLDIMGNLKSEFVEIYLGKNAQAEELEKLNDPQVILLILSSFVQAVVEDVTLPAVTNDIVQKKYAKQYLAVTDILNRNSLLVIKNKIKEVTHPCDSEQAHALLVTLIEMKVEDEKPVKELVIKDLNQKIREENPAWYKVRLKFWLDVMWYAALKKNPLIYQAIHEALASIDGIGFDLEKLELKEKFLHCLDAGVESFSSYVEPAGKVADGDPSGKREILEDKDILSLLGTRDKIFIIKDILNAKQKNWVPTTNFETRVIAGLNELEKAKDNCLLPVFYGRLRTFHQECLDTKRFFHMSSNLLEKIEEYVKQIERIQMAAFKKDSAPSSSSSSTSSMSIVSSSNLSAHSFLSSTSTSFNMSHDESEDPSKKHRP